MLAFVAPSDAPAQTLPGVPVAASITVNTGGAQPAITAPTANSLDVTLNATRTVINWDSFHVSAADAVTFHFNANSDIVLNKSPTQVQLDAGGHVTGLVGAAAGGNIWFYSPQGVVVSPGAVLSAGNFVFARGDNIVDATFVDAASPLSVLRSASDSLIQIDTVNTATSASISATGDLVLTASTGDLNATTALAAGAASVSATTGSITIGEVTATGGLATVTAPAGSITLTSLSGGTGVSATGQTGVSVTSAATTGATADIVLIDGVSASLGSGTSGRDIKITAPTASLGSGTAAGSVFLTGTTGGASTTGAVQAGDDIEITATAGSVSVTGAGLTSTGAAAVGDAHVLAMSTGAAVSVSSATTQGTGAAAGDVTISAATTGSLGAGSASNNLKVQGVTASLGTGSATGTVTVTGTSGGATVTTSATGGGDVNVTAAGDVNANSLTSGGAVLAQSSGGAASVLSATTQGAAADITVSGATTASLGSGNSTRDISVTAPAASLGFSGAARSVFVTATTGTATVNGAVSAGDDIEVTATTGNVSVTGPGLTSTGAAAVGDAHVLAQSTAGSVSVSSATTQGTGAAAGDIKISGATSASLGGGASSRDIKVLAPSASLGTSTAARDIFVTATTGGATTTGTVAAGDDVEITATTGDVSANALTSTGAGAVGDAHVLAMSTGGAVSVTSAATQGTGAAAGDVVVSASTSASLGSGNSTHDVKVQGTSASLGSGTVANDAFVTASTGQASLSGAVTAGEDIQVASTSGQVSASGTSSATRDVQLKAGTSVAASGSSFIAGRDFAASAGSGNVALGSASAGDDIAVRATSGAVTGSGDLLAGQTHDPADPDTAGVADALTGATITGHGVDIKAQTVAITGNVSAGRAPDVSETLGAAQLASDVIVEATAADPSAGVAALQLATGPGKAVTAHQDVSLKTENATASSIQTGDVFAGRDVAVDSAAGNITMGSALAGDDVVIRAPAGLIAVTGNVESGRDSPGMTPTDSLGAGDALNTARPFLDFDGNPATVFSVVGFDVNIAGQAIHIGGTTAAGRQPSTDAPTTPGPIDATTSDVRLETRVSLTPTANLTPDITLGDVIATRDMQIDSAAGITGGALMAGRDVAVLGRGGATPGAAPGDHTGAGVTVTSARAGDDALLFSIFGRTRITGSVTSGLAFPRLAPTTDTVIDGATQAADQLPIYLHYFDLDNASAPYVLPGSVVHISGQGVMVGGAITAHGVGGDVRVLSTSGDISVSGAVNAGGLATFQTSAGTGGAVSVGAVTAVGDVSLDGGGAGIGVQAGAITSSSGDVAIRARDGTSASTGSIAAADDVVIRASGGLTVTGTVSAGGGADSAGLGDGLVTSDGALTLGAHAYDLTGHNVDIVAGPVSISGATTATGTGSDVRIQSSGPIGLSTVTATRDVLADGGGTVTTGALSAGRDVGVRSTGGGVTVGVVSAGDDVVIRAQGAIQANGTLTAGSGSDSNATDQAGDLIAAAAPTTVTAGLDLTGRNVDVRSSGGDITVAGAVNAPTDARFQAGGAVSVAAVTAGRDILLDGTSATATGNLGATSGDVAVRGSSGTVDLAAVTAGDDVVVRASGAVTISGAVHAGGAADTAGIGDSLTTAAGALTLEGHAYDQTGADIDIVGGGVSVSGAMTAAGANSDARVQSTGAINLAAVTAGRDVLADGAGSVTTGALGGGRDVGVRSTGATVSLASATAGDDVVLRAQGDISVTGAVTAGTGADSGAADQAGDLIAGAAPITLTAGLNLTGRNVDVGSAAGAITVGGAVNSPTDARFQGAGAVSVAAVTAGRDILLDGGSVTASGALTATSSDVAVWARSGAASLARVTAGDDVVVRAAGAVTVSGSVHAGGAGDSAGLGDSLTTTAGGLTLEGHTYEQTGTNIDIVGRGVSVSGAMTAVGAGSDVRVQSTGAINLAAVTAGRDVLADGVGAVTTGALSAGRDVGVRSTGSSVSVASASAGDDLVIRAQGAIHVSGALTAGGGIDSSATDQAGDLIAGAAAAGLTNPLAQTGQNVDLRSVTGAITVGGAVNAASDARFQTLAGGGGSVSVAAVTAGREILLDGSGVTATGALSATSGDVAVRGRDGGAVNLAGVSAGDDVVVRTTGAVTISGAVHAGGAGDSNGLGDALTTVEGGLTLEGHTYDQTGTNIDIVGGGPVHVTGAMTATGVGSDVRVQSAGAISLAAVTAGRDVLVDGGSTVLTGALSGGRDVGVRSTGGGATVTVGGAASGDDVVIRAKGSIFVTGGLSAGGGGDSHAADQAGDLMFGVANSSLAAVLDLVGSSVDVRSTAGAISVTGAVNAVTDARFQTETATGGGVSVAAVTAGRDVLLDGGGADGVTATGTLTAINGDVAVRGRDGSAVSLAGITAGDDVVVRTTGAVSISGPVATGGAADSAGLGDQLTTTDGVVTLEGHAYDQTGHNIDILAGSITAAGTLSAGGSASDVRIQSIGVINVAGLTAGRDVMVDGATTVSTGVATAGRDVGIRSTGASSTVTVGGAVAGDDVVIRGAAAISVTGALSAGGVGDSNASDQAGDLMFGVSKSSLAGVFDLLGSTVDVRSTAGAITVAGATTAATDARFQTAATTGGAVTVGAVTAGRDVFLDGGGAGGTTATGLLVATNGDVAVRARDNAAISLTGATAGDDIVLRGAAGITSTDTLATTGKPSTIGVADRLTDPAEGGVLTIGGLSFGLSDSDIDIVGAAVNVQRTAAAGSVHIKADNGMLSGGAAAGIDILIDSRSWLMLGDLSASGDIALRARGGALSVGNLTAGDDIVLRATAGVIAGRLQANGPEHAGVGDQLFASDPTGLNGAFNVQGNVIDVKTATGAISIGGAQAGGDVHLQAPGQIGISGATTSGGNVFAEGSTVTTGDITASRDIALWAHGGGVNIGAGQAGGTLAVRANGDVTASGGVSSGQGGAGVGLAAQLVSAAGALSFFGQSVGPSVGVIDLSGSNIQIGGAIQTGNGGALRLQTAGSVTLADAAVAGDILIQAGGGVTGGNLRSGGDIALQSQSAGVSLISAHAAASIVLRAPGDIAVSGALASDGAIPSADGAAAQLLASTGSSSIFGAALQPGVGVIDLSAAKVTIGGSINAKTGGVHLRVASTGTTTLADASVGGDIAVDAGGEVKAGALSAGRDIGVRSGGGISAVSLSAGVNIVLRSPNDISISGSVTDNGVAGAADGAGARLLAASGASALFGGTSDPAVGSIDLRAANIRLGGPVNAASGGVNLRLQASGVVALADATVGGEIAIDSNGEVTGGSLSAGRDLAVRSATGSVTLAGATAGDDVVLRAAQNVTVTGAMKAGGSTDSVGAGDALFSTDRTALAGDFDLAGGNIDVRARGAITVGGPAGATGDARFQTVGGGAVSLGAVSAGGDVLADGASVTAGGTLSAGRDVAVRGRTGAVKLAALSAGDDIAIRAAGDVQVSGAVSSGTAASANGPADRLISSGEGGAIRRLVDPTAATPSIEAFTLSGGDIDIRSGGAIALGGNVTAGGSSSLHLQAVGKISTAAISAGESIFARGGDFVLGGAWSGKVARLEVTAAGGLALGDGVTAANGGVALSNAAVGQLGASTVQIFVGDSSGAARGGALSIGTLSIDVSKVKTSFELYAGAKTDAVITGVLAPSGAAANSTVLRIGAPNSDAGDWTPGNIRVVANAGGSIGFATTSSGRLFSDVRAFGGVELNAAGDILIGYQDFIDKLSATDAAGVPAAVKTIVTPPSSGGPRILLAAGTLTLRANGKVAQQDTEGLLGSTPTGLYLFGGTATTPALVLGRTSAKATGEVQLPSFIELNGALSANGVMMTGSSASLSNVILFDKGVQPSPNYRLNTCAILQPGSCTSSQVHSTVSIAPDQFTNLTVQDRTAAAGTADPTVASATNEEVWKDPI